MLEIAECNQRNKVMRGGGRGGGVRSFLESILVDKKYVLRRHIEFTGSENTS